MEVQKAVAENNPDFVVTFQTSLYFRLQLVTSYTLFGILENRLQ